MKTVLKNFTDAFDMHPFTDRANSLGTRKTFSLYGRLTTDLSTCKKILLPNTKVIEYNTVGDTKTPFLRCFPFISNI